MTLPMALLFDEIFALRAFADMTIHGILAESGLSAEDLASGLCWKPHEVDWFLRHESLPDGEGPEAFSMSLTDLEGKSPARARYAIENAIVKALVMIHDPETCNRFIARMLRVKEWRIRQIRIRAGIPPARTIRATRLSAQEALEAVPDGSPPSTAQESESPDKPATPTSQPHSTTG